MSMTIDKTLTLESITCCSCGMIFYVDEFWKKKRREDHACFYCPNGHCQSYSGESEAEKLRKQLAQEQHRREQLEAERTSLRNQRDAITRKHVAAKGRITRLRKRCVEGLCTCCNKKFDDLEAHMKSEHPDAVTREL